MQNYAGLRTETYYYYL